MTVGQVDVSGIIKEVWFRWLVLNVVKSDIIVPHHSFDSHNTFSLNRDFVSSFHTPVMPVTTRKSKSKGLASDDIPPSETTRRTRSVTRAQTNTDPKSVASASTATKVNPKTHKSKSKLAAAHVGII